jgi:hypothetical protein
MSGIADDNAGFVECWNEISTQKQDGPLFVIVWSLGGNGLDRNRTCSKLSLVYMK